MNQGKLSFDAVVLYWSGGGNTARVAKSLYDELASSGHSARLEEVTAGLTLDYLEYQLILVGAPVYQFLPPEPMVDFLKRQQREHGYVRLAAPERPGHYAAVFCTYAGPHTGIREAVPALKYMGQFLEHAGIPVVGEWPVVGCFHGESRREANTLGRLGDIRGRPNEADLRDVRGRLSGLLRRLEPKLRAARQGEEK